MDILRNNIPFFIFIFKFAGSYILLSIMYWLYLAQYDVSSFEVDGMTNVVARQASGFVDLVGELSYLRKNTSQAAYNFFVNGRKVARIVEGCNAISVMILFSAFIVAFSTTIKYTSLYILMGIILLHIMNIVRIGLLTIMLYYYKEHAAILHDIVFPLVIYGTVFILWVVWVTMFTKQKNAN